MQKSDQIGELAAALAKAQGQFEAVERNREVEVTMKSGGKYSFSYATLDTVVDTIRKPLSENGLCYTQGVDGSDNGTVVQTMLMHSSGQWLATTTPVRTDGTGAQALGSGITYAKRYALTALFGIVAEDDDDANDADGNKRTVRDTRSPKSNRSADDPNWTGPLGKSQLKEKLRALSLDIDNAQDENTITALLEANTDIINQCARDLTDWWLFKKDGEVRGLKHSIHLAGQQLNVSFQRFIDAAEKSEAPRKKPNIRQAAE